MALPLDRLHIYADGLDHPECVTLDSQGTVWAGGEAGQIYRISADGSRVDEITRIDGGFILGLASHPSARWLAACDLKNRCVWRIDARTGRTRLLADRAGRHRILIPNSVCFDRSNRLFLSDSGAPKMRTGKILAFDPDGRGEVWHAGPFDFANGIVLAPDDRSLYVAESFLPGVSRVPIRPDGTAGKATRILRLPKTIPDGLAFSPSGELHVTCYTPARIYRIRNGRAQVLVEDWETHLLAFPTNLVFVSPTRLLVANLGRWHLTRVDL